MNIREFTKPVTAKSLNESLAKRFGSKINIDAFTTEQLQDARNKIRTRVFNVETTESFDAVQKEEYSKNKLFLDVLNAALAERDDVSIAIDEAIQQVNEGEEDKAELVMAAKDMVDRVTGWMEDTAEMQTESMLELADAIRDEMGSEASESFTNTVKPALEAMYTAMESTRISLTQGVGQLTGEAEPMDTMGDDDMDMEPTVDGDDMDMDIEPEGDDFEADDAAAGGEEEAGREKRESATPKGKSLDEGATKNAMMADAEKMSKAAFIKKYGKENAGTWENMNESIKEGATKDAMMADAEKMSKDAFCKKYMAQGMSKADCEEQWSQMNESSKKK